MFRLNFSRNFDATTSSTTRASQLNVTVIALSTSEVNGSRSTSSLSMSTVFDAGTNRVPPTAMMQVWGGLMTAVNSRIPNIPRLEILRQERLSTSVEYNKPNDVNNQNHATISSRESPPLKFLRLQLPLPRSSGELPDLTSDRGQSLPDSVLNKQDFNSKIST